LVVNKDFKKHTEMRTMIKCYNGGVRVEIILKIAPKWSSYVLVTCYLLICNMIIVVEQDVEICIEENVVVLR
jgi:hypothetical protein